MVNAPAFYALYNSRVGLFEGINVQLNVTLGVILRRQLVVLDQEADLVRFGIPLCCLVLPPAEHQVQEHEAYQLTCRADEVQIPDPHWVCVLLEVATQRSKDGPSKGAANLEDGCLVSL